MVNIFSHSGKPKFHYQGNGITHSSSSYVKVASNRQTLILFITQGQGPDNMSYPYQHMVNIA